MFSRRWNRLANIESAVTRCYKQQRKIRSVYVIMILMKINKKRRHNLTGETKRKTRLAAAAGVHDLLYAQIVASRRCLFRVRLRRDSCTICQVYYTGNCGSNSIYYKHYKYIYIYA